MCRHIYNLYIVECDVKQPISLSISLPFYLRNKNEKLCIIV